MLKILNKNDENIVCIPSTIIVDAKITDLRFDNGPNPVLTHFTTINKFIRKPTLKTSKPIVEAFSIVKDLEIKSTNQSDFCK